MAMDNCASILIKMQKPQKHRIDIATQSYFESSFKAHFKLLEKQIHSNWRLHSAYYEAQGQLCLMTADRVEALEIVKLMLNTAKSKTCSLPVKKLICEKLAEMISTHPNCQVRQLTHKTMTQSYAVSRTSQQRKVFFMFLECLLPLISSMHFNQVYGEMFLEFREEPV